MEPQGSSTVFQVLQAVEWSLEAGADIMNMSLGHAPTPGGEVLVEWMAVTAAAQLGTQTCAAAGNEALTIKEPMICSPSDCTDAISVGALDSTLERAGFSNFGPAFNPLLSGHKPDLAAPGVGIISTRSRASILAGYQLDSRFVKMDGTSMATPVVSGILATALGYLRANNHSIRATELKALLLDSCETKTNVPNFQIGHGIPNLTKFFSNVKSLVPQVSDFQVARPRIEATPKVAEGSRRADTFNNLRSAEEHCLTRLMGNVDRIAAQAPELFDASTALRVEWESFNHLSDLKDLQVIHNVSRARLETIPLLERRVATLLEKDHPIARIAIQFLVDQESLCRNRHRPISATKLRAMYERTLSEHQQAAAPLCPFYGVIISDLDSEFQSASIDNNLALLSVNGNSWTYEGPFDHAIYPSLCSPEDEQTLAHRIRVWLDEQVADPILAEKAQTSLKIPLSLLLRIGRTITTYSLECHSDTYAFFRR